MDELKKGLYFVTALAILFLLGWLIMALAPVLTPFLIAAAIAYLVNPIVEKLSSEVRYKIPRTLAVSMVFVFIALLIALVLLFVVPMLHRQVNQLISALPHMLEWVQNTLLPRVEGLLGFELQKIDLQTLRSTLMEHWSKATNAVSLLGQWLFHSGMAIIHWSVNLMLIVVVAFYLLRDWSNLLEGVKRCLPQSKRDFILNLMKKSDETMGTFLRGQLSVMACLGIIYSIGLGLIGIQFSLLLGMGAGLLSIVPYLGSITGFVATMIVAATQAPDIWLFVWVIVVFGVGQTLEGAVLTPLLMGDKLGLHPVAVIFAVLAGGQLFGIVGVLLAIPLAAILVVVLREPLLEWARTS